MNLAQFLDFESVRIGVAANGKRAMLHHLATVAAPRVGLSVEAVNEALLAREKLGSTGFGNGVAIPHAKVDGIMQVFALVARLNEGIDYKAIDGQPVDIVFLLLSPFESGAEHLKALAAISRVVRHPAMLDKLRGARSRDAFAAVLMGADERDAA